MQAFISLDESKFTAVDEWKKERNKWSFSSNLAAILQRGAGRLDEFSTLSSILNAEEKRPPRRRFNVKKFAAAIWRRWIESKASLAYRMLNWPWAVASFVVHAEGGLRLAGCLWSFRLISAPEFLLYVVFYSGLSFLSSSLRNARGLLYSSRSA